MGNPLREGKQGLNILSRPLEKKLESLVICWSSSRDVYDLQGLVDPLGLDLREFGDP